MGHYIKDCRKKQSDDLRRNTPGTSQPPQRLAQQQQQSYPPQQSSQQKTDNQRTVAGRAYAATIEQVTKGELVQGTILVAGHAAFTLFDCGASHSFIASRFASSLPMSAALLNYPLEVRTPTGDQSLCTLYIPSVEVSVASQNLSADLILLDMTEFDVILGMD